MLKGIPKIISPELLKILCEMGHGDEIVIADGNFPSENYGKRIMRADGIGGVDMLKAVLALIPLDTYADKNFMLMETVKGDPKPPIGGIILMLQIKQMIIFVKDIWNVLRFMNRQNMHMQ